MQIDSLFNSLNDSFQLGSTDQVDRAELLPTVTLESEIQRSFDPGSQRDWCELIRDTVALANSGGGLIVVSGAVAEKELRQRLENYTSSVLVDVHLETPGQSSFGGTVIKVGPFLLPVAFTCDGIFPRATNSADNVEVFHAGSYYFRHGNHSEPGTTDDIRAAFDRVLRRVRRRWIRGIRRVLEAPLDFDPGIATKRAAGKQKKLEQKNLQPVRIVTDPDAPALQPQDVDRLYPWRQKDLLRELNTRIGRRALNSYDIQAVRRQHRLDERPDFVFNLPGAGRRYSPAVADWMIEQLGRDPEFFRVARAADHEILKLRRRKPK